MLKNSQNSIEIHLSKKGHYTAAPFDSFESCQTLTNIAIYIRDVLGKSQRIFFQIIPRNSLEKSTEKSDNPTASKKTCKPKIWETYSTRYLLICSTQYFILFLMDNEVL